MKKGIVLEQHRKYTIVLTKDGEFRKIDPIRNADIGAEVSFDAEPKRKISKLKVIPAAMVAAACLFFALFHFIPSQNNTYAYVVVDINPSVELEVTEDMRVNAVRPINRDAEIILEQIDAQNKKVDTVMDEIIHTSEELGFVDEEEKNVLVGVSYADETAEEDVPSSIEQYAETNTEWNITAFHVPLDVREEAVKSNTSMNELLAAKLEEENEMDENLDDQEKEMLHSFYNKEEEDDDEVEEEDSSIETEVETDETVDVTTEENNTEQQDQPIEQPADDSSEQVSTPNHAPADGQQINEEDSTESEQPADPDYNPKGSQGSHDGNHENNNKDAEQPSNGTQTNSNQNHEQPSTPPDKENGTVPDIEGNGEQESQVPEEKAEQ